MANLHSCGACGGSGREGNQYVGVPKRFCSVCLGAGSFPDSMPVADALADAEMLLRVAATTAQ